MSLGNVSVRGSSVDSDLSSIGWILSTLRVEMTKKHSLEVVRSQIRTRSHRKSLLVAKTLRASNLGTGKSDKSTWGLIFPNPKKGKPNYWSCFFNPILLYLERTILTHSFTYILSLRPVYTCTHTQAAQ